jgi:hypothetical protein
MKPNDLHTKMPKPSADPSLTELTMPNATILAFSAKILEPPYKQSNHDCFD